MSDTLKVSIGQHSDKGCKEVNQDFHGACMPQGLALAAKGVVVALADGISSSDVSHIASAAAVHGLAAGLLLHLRRLERQALGTVRAGGHQLVAARPNPAQPLPL
jgi:serine/threonine protein phosphatase PrpC